MASGQERYLAERHEYHLRVPKVPRQIVDVFARDIPGGNYGLSAEKIDDLMSYARLQVTLNGFNDLTFSPDFLSKIPEDLRKKLGDNLFPGIALADSEIPTTDKVHIAEMLAADRLTETLSQEPVEVWVNEGIKKELEALGQTVDLGLQRIDYRQLPLKAKQYLVSIMERQEAQVHVVLAARQRFPQGVPQLDLFSLGDERTTFSKLVDLDEQYKVAQQAIDNPLLVSVFEAVEEKRKAKSDDDEKPAKRDYAKELREEPVDVEYEAQRKWWIYEFGDTDRFDKVTEAVVAYLRPKYARKTIYEIFEADTKDKQDEVLAAFWRTGESKRIDLNGEPWEIDELYLKPDGVLEINHEDDVYGSDEEPRSVVTGGLEGHWTSVAMVDQAVKWIQDEQERMQQVKKAWAESGLSSEQAVEISLGAVFGLLRDEKEQEEIDGLPKWFLDAIKQEMGYYRHLITYVPQFELEDLLSFFRPRETGNMLKSYFDLANARLERDKHLIVDSAELYKDLDLDPSASADNVKKAYRKIAQETRAIQISSPDQFDREEWQAMNARFIRASKAYKALSRRRPGEARVVTLGRLSSYFSA